MKRKRVRRIRNKILAWGLAVAMVIPCVEGLGQIIDQGTVKRAKAYCFCLKSQSIDGAWKYTELPNHSVVLNAYIGEEVETGQLEIPEYVDGRQVVAVDGYDAGDDFFSNKKFLKKVVIPEGVTRIGDKIFQDCTSLKEVELSNTVKRIGAYAFSGCTSLEQISLYNVCYLADNAFAGCTGLTEMDMSRKVTSVGDNVFAGCTNLVEVKDSPKITHYGNGVYQGCGLKQIEIKGEMQTVPERMFAGCTSLVSVHVSESSGIQNIGDYAFSECGLLSEINLAETMGQIGKYAFQKCTSLQSIGMKKVDRIGTAAFQEAGLKSVELAPGENAENGCGLIKESAFEGSALNTISFQGPMIVKSKAFSKCSSLSTMKNLHWMTECGEGAFKRHNWEDEDYQDGLVIKDGWLLAVDPDYYFGKVQIPDTVIQIADAAFKNNKNIYEVTIPDSVKKIGNYAFYGCLILDYINFPDTHLEIGNQAFASTGHWQSYDDDGLCVDRYHLVKCDSNLTGKVVIPSYVEYIDEKAFYGCKNITSITFEEGSDLKYIGAGAFAGCESLTGIKFPEENTIEIDTKDVDVMTDSQMIGGVEVTATTKGGIFGGCHSLKSLTISKNMIPSEKSGDALFQLIKYCDDLETLFINSTSFMPYGVTSEENIPVGIKKIELGEEITKLPETLLEVLRPEIIRFTENLSDIDSTEAATEIWSRSIDFDTFLGEGGALCVRDTLLSLKSEQVPKNTGQINNGDPVTYCSLNLYRVKKIAGGAFRKAGLDLGTYMVQLNGDVEYIGKDAFPAGTIIVTYPGSYAAGWARENGFDCLQQEEIDGYFYNNMGSPWIPEDTFVPTATASVTVSPAVRETKAPSVTVTRTPSPVNSTGTPAPPATRDPVAVTSAPGQTGAPEKSTETKPSVSKEPLPLVSSIPAATKVPSGKNTAGKGIMNLQVENVAVSKSGVYRSGLKLAWKGSKETKYYIYRSLKKKTGYIRLKKTAKELYVDMSVQKGVRYYYKVQVVSGNTKTYSEPVSATVNKKLITPVVQIKGTKTTYVITVKKAEGTRYQFQLRMKGYNHGKWFDTKRYQGSLKNRIVMKKNPGSSSRFDMRLRTQMKVKGSWKNSSWCKTIRYR